MLVKLNSKSREGHKLKQEEIPTEPKRNDDSTEKLIDKTTSKVNINRKTKHKRPRIYLDSQHDGNNDCTVMLTNP